MASRQWARSTEENPKRSGPGNDHRERKHVSQSTEVLVGARVDRQTVEALSHAKSEPSWLREWRLAAFDRYAATPLPTLRDEEWRRTDLRALRLDDAVTYAEPTSRVSSLDALD